jgi:hypothetical protein
MVIDLTDTFFRVGGFETKNCELDFCGDQWSAVWTSIAQFTASSALWKLVSVPSPISPIIRPLNFGSSLRRSARCSASARSARRLVAAHYRGIARDIAEHDRS